VKNLLIAFFACNAVFCACSQAQQPVENIHYVKLDARHTVKILDSVRAAETILYDATDRFFDRVTACDISIQMKRPLEQTREELMPYYMGFLQTDMTNFKDNEVKFVEEVIENIFKTCNGVSTDIFPDTLTLIKTHSNHYGAGVWYTRENCIIIPADELERRKTNPFTSTMTHEVFHVYSRTHPKQSKSLYQLIGFQDIGMDNIILPPALKERVFHNPDGVNYAQRINLAQKDGTTISAIPIIYANQLGYKENMDDFFGYIEFALFEIRPNDNGKWNVLTKEDGFSSTLKMEDQTDFFAQIKDNTGYIIHPDEILADNFSFIMTAKKSPAITAKFSAPGKKLLADMEQILKSN
jgi:hypothetical protein